MQVAVTGACGGRGEAASSSSEERVLRFGRVNRVLGESYGSIISIQEHFGLIMQLSTRTLSFLTKDVNTS